jgi:beta-galactosidase/beta-glucuronidase
LKRLVTLTGLLRYPQLWSAETPQLYTLVVSLHSSLAAANDDREVLHCETARVGVRQIRVGGPHHALQVNHRALTVAGINRHEFDPVTGRAVSFASMRRDAELLKQLNFNAVRCSHYPNHPLWLEICDEVGLYVIDEANIETHGFQTLGQPVGYLSNLPEWRAAFGGLLALSSPIPLSLPLSLPLSPSLFISDFISSHSHHISSYSFFSSFIYLQGVECLGCTRGIRTSAA